MAKKGAAKRKKTTKPKDLTKRKKSNASDEEAAYIKGGQAAQLYFKKNE